MGRMGFCLLALVLVAATAQAAEEKTAAEIWHEYCEMTTHVKVDGWEFSSIKSMPQLPINNTTVKCTAEVGKDFDGKIHTNVSAYLSKSVVQSISDYKATHDAHAIIADLPGDVDKDQACATVTKFIEKSRLSGGFLKADVLNKKIRQDWISSKNTNVNLGEEIHITFGNIQFRMLNNVPSIGKFCANKPPQK